MPQTYHSLSGLLVFQLMYAVDIRSRTLATDLVLHVVFLLQRFYGNSEKQWLIVTLRTFLCSQAYGLLRAFGGAVSIFTLKKCGVWVSGVFITKFLFIKIY